MGHALVSTLQDILIRWKRMQGYEVLWVPGLDHAGIATQTVVERHLMATEGKRRTEYTREAFLAHVEQWRQRHGRTMVQQLRRMGCSCDWSRERFTLDATCSRAVRTLFKQLFDKGLIYRGDYIVNWDPVTQTALADDEVEVEERASSLVYFRYPLSDGSGHITVATTRPETLLGDMAVAVSPEDGRYRALIGKRVVLPLVGREIPIIADHRIDPSFGSGAVKVTPAHDANDYAMARDHDLPLLNILTPDGRINEAGGAFCGLTREEARSAVVEAMRAQGLLEKVVPHTVRLGLSYRSKAVIEPYLSKQWFVKMEGFGKRLSQFVREGQVRLIPKQWESTYFQWIDHLRDWCISRQLWFGHRIPIWYSKRDPNYVLCFEGEGLPPEVAQDPEAWVQDEDVLDTWFSSALWPVSTLGWPEKSADLAKFYPTSVLVTGHDILFFWVARMLAFGEETMQAPPFPDVFLHGLIFGKSYWRERPEGGIIYLSPEEKREYDLGAPLPKEVFSKWEKLSKSKGNVIDPLAMIEEYGTDAMRMTLASMTTSSPQIDLDRRRFEEFKNFANKIWNGARFLFMHLSAFTGADLSEGLNFEKLTLDDRWILARFDRISLRMNELLNNWHFDLAAVEGYDFFWKEFCAYYLELVKPALFGKGVGDAQEKRKVLAIVLCGALRLLHPFAPFLTEELFGRLRDHLGEVSLREGQDGYTAEAVGALQARGCIVAPYPRGISQPDRGVEERFTLVEGLVHAIRNIRGEMQIAPGEVTDLYLVGGETIEELVPLIRALVRLGKVVVGELPSGIASQAVVEGIQVVVPLPKGMQERERVRRERERERLEKSIASLEGQLANREFLERAKPELVARQRERLDQEREALQKLSS